MSLKGILGPRWRQRLLGAVLTALVALAFCRTKLGGGLDNRSYDWPFLFRSDIATEGVTLLYLDLDSAEKLGEPRRASWSRDRMAQVLERLQAYHPRAVILDVLFHGTNGHEQAGNHRLAEAARALGCVVTGARPKADLEDGQFYETRLHLPFEELRTNVSWGFAEVGEPDRSIRQHNSHDSSRFGPPSMAWRAAQLTMTNAPPPADQPRWFNFYGPPGSLRHYSCYRIFETNETNQIPVAHLSNQVIVVGALYDMTFSGGRGSDDFRTPYTAKTRKVAPGPEIVATAYLNLVRGDWLRRLPYSRELLVLMALGALLGFGLAGVSPSKAIALAALAALALALLGLWMPWRTGVWFPWLIPVTVQAPCALVWSLLAYVTVLIWEKYSLEKALVLANRDRGTRTPTAPGTALATHPEPSLASAPTLGLVPATQATIPDHELLRCIGRGAYGEVWLARDAIGTYHAVKIVYRSAFPDALPLEREFNGLRKFTPISRSHPNFVHILHVGRNDAAGYIYYVMEPGDDELRGQKIDPQHYQPLTLARLIQKNGRLPLPECLDLCVQLTDALDYLHRQQLIHRDIKPDNIIFVNGVPKFIDIGLVTDMATKERDVSSIGTSGRMAPEGPGTPASDVFSFGKVLYEAGLGLPLSRYPDLPTALVESPDVGSSRVDLQACKLEYSIVSPK